MPMQDLADKISALITIVLPIVSGIAGWVGASLKKAKKKDADNEAEMKAIKDGLKGLLRAKIIDLGLHYIEEKSIPPYGMETLEKCYGPYDALGDGDPSIGHIMSVCRSLPVRPGSE